MRGLTRWMWADGSRTTLLMKATHSSSGISRNLGGGSLTRELGGKEQRSNEDNLCSVVVSRVWERLARCLHGASGRVIWEYFFFGVFETGTWFEATGKKTKRRKSQGWACPGALRRAPGRRGSKQGLTYPWPWPPWMPQVLPTAASYHTWLRLGRQ